MSSVMASWGIPQSVFLLIHTVIQLAAMARIPFLVPGSQSFVVLIVLLLLCDDMNWGRFAP
jgi:hypothetical protein